jgi:hypothetical protein
VAAQPAANHYPFPGPTISSISRLHISDKKCRLKRALVVPLLPAICAAPNDKRLPAVIWIDGILALAIGVLAYREIFSFLPGMSEPEQWLAVTRIAYAYDAEEEQLAELYRYIEENATADVALRYTSAIVESEAVLILHIIAAARDIEPLL